MITALWFMANGALTRDSNAQSPPHQITERLRPLLKVFRRAPPPSNPSAVARFPLPPLGTAGP